MNPLVNQEQLSRLLEVLLETRSIAEAKQLLARHFARQLDITVKIARQRLATRLDALEREQAEIR